MGYPVPDKPFSQEFAYFLVAIPNEVEFIRAARTAYTELSDVWKWGEEKTHPDAPEIRQLWLNAASRTYELMGWPETLLSHVDEIEPLLRLLQSVLEAQMCCDVVPGADSLVGAHEGELDTSDTDIANDVVPSPYVDAADFLANYHCRASVYMADVIIQWPSEVTRAVGGGISGVIAAIIILTGGAFIGIGVVPLLTLATLTGIVTAIADLSEAWGNLTEDTPTAAETLLQARRQDIICAIYQANDAEGAHAAVAAIVAEELSPGWANLFLLWPWGSTIAKVFNGDSEAPAVSANECVCAPFSGYEHFYYGSEPTAGNWNSQSVLGCHWIDVRLFETSAKTVKESADFTIASGGPTSSCGGVNHYRIWSIAAWEASQPADMWDSNTPPTAVHGHRIAIVGNAPYSLVAVVE